jgi:hypothetical protein
MCARKETDLRESPNDSTPAGGVVQGTRGETCYATFDENPVSSFPERTVFHRFVLGLNRTIKERPWLRREQNWSMNIRVIIVCKGARKPSIEIEIHEEGEWICNLFLFPIPLNVFPVNTFCAIIVKVNHIVWRYFY